MMRQAVIVALLFLGLCAGLPGRTQRTATPPAFKTPFIASSNHGPPADRPLIIAHRGASGVLPEHTVPAYREAVAQGADFIECDVVLTKDLHLACFHDNWMTEKTTDVAVVFPNRRATYVVSDQRGTRNVTGFFTFDFTLSELQRIHLRQGLSFRDHRYDGRFGLATLEELVLVVAAHSGGEHRIGLYLETKQPELVNALPIMQSANTSIEELLVALLRRHGYTRQSDPCFLQSFNVPSLAALRLLSPLPRVLLVSATSGAPTDTDLERHARAGYYGLGFSKRLIVEKGTDGWVSRVTNLTARAHRVGLKVHPYTFRNEDRYLAWDYAQDAFREMDHFLQLGIDGFFTDFPGSCAAFLNARYSVCENLASSCGWRAVGWLTLVASLLYVTMVTDGLGFM